MGKDKLILFISSLVLAKDVRDRNAEILANNKSIAMLQKQMNDGTKMKWQS